MKVDEQFKCKDCDNYNLCNYYDNRRETSFICKEFQNQWGFIEELEKIRDEIQDLVDFEETCCGNAILGYQCLSVINNKITELKGE